MSTDTTDRMRRYETDHDSGDTNTSETATSGDPRPAVSPAPDHLGNGASDNPDPIPMATPQSPIQTDSDIAQTEDSPEAGDDNSPEVRSNKGGEKEYREV